LQAHGNLLLFGTFLMLASTFALLGVAVHFELLNMRRFEDEKLVKQAKQEATYSRE
jgi:hypothetical protein